MSTTITSESVESIRIDFAIAHALFHELVYYVPDKESFLRSFDKLSAMAPRLGAFVASTLGISVDEAADKTLAMIDNMGEALAFFTEHFE